MVVLPPFFVCLWLCLHFVDIRFVDNVIKHMPHEEGVGEVRRGPPARTIISNLMH